MIIYLAKIFREAKHAHDFLKGKLYANGLAYFKRIEDDPRGDEDEGAIMPKRDGLTIELTATQTTGEVCRIRTSGDELASPLVIRPRWFDHINVFCMYAGHPGEFSSISEQNVREFKKQIEIPENFENLGRHAVVIRNTREFIRRVRLEAERKGYGICDRLVRYYDAEVGTPLTRSNIETIFLKRKDYEYQKEFRFAIDTGAAGCSPVTLCIGGIEDIAVGMAASDINKRLRVRTDPSHDSVSIMVGNRDLASSSPECPGTEDLLSLT